MSKRCSVIGCNKFHSAKSRSECKDCHAINMETTSISEQSSTEQAFTFTQPIYSQFGTIATNNSMFLTPPLQQQQQQQPPLPPPPPQQQHQQQQQQQQLPHAAIYTTK